ncbi:rRNA cytosine-C5-methyltransferase [Bacteroides sp. 214]|uniref:methyltransferase RsmF C-terminal domain-like protein n=1 Tax=Bacteroides sp. 214 TaxID=2302935 RepID=UPI0013D5C1AD|nr:rRNA cytosine-C5-methyltransferase [Bacteroides sp. 214]NDW13392.1 rRNA cytosine-C5-methyltransferase [Bacteroides sp. 214]
MNLPHDFVEQIKTLLGEAESTRFFQALQEPTPISIRLNPLKQTSLNSPMLADAVPWCDAGYFLSERLTFTFDPLFHAGCYYVQEAASMFLEQAVKQYVKDAVLALDLCAAPGGKSTHLRSLLPEGSLLVANEVIRNRSQVLAENLTKWGHPDVVVTNNDPADFGKLENQFDVILTDVPCSGEGMFRKDPAAIDEWSLANVEICWQRQRRILADIWPCLKPGGVLIYSTCTYNTKENEENVAWLMTEFGAESLQVETPDEWNITGNLSTHNFPVYRFLPHKTKGEGFFMAILRKPAEDINLRMGDVKNLLNKHLRVIRPAGIEPGVVKGKDVIPSHALAMNAVGKPLSYPTHDLTYEQAIAYLRREAVVLDSSAPRGYLLVTYKQIPLGFVKNIGNRANNLYPQEWRIRSGYLPENLTTLFSRD